MKIAVTGSTGQIGAAVVETLKAEGHDVRRLVRRAAQDLSEIQWSPEASVAEPTLLENLDAFVHLAGENIGRRWTESLKKKAYQSRVEGTRLLSQTLANLHNPPKVFIAASAVGYYDRKCGHCLTEDSPPGEGFLAELVRDWEKASAVLENTTTRVVRLRIGMVLSSRGGALPRMLLPFKLGLGGKIGSGRQQVSWIALEDLVGIIKFCLENDRLAGPVNAVAPNPVTNAVFTETLAKILHRPAFFAVPGFVLKLLYGQMAEEVLLHGARAIPSKLLEAGFQYKYPELETALRGIIGR